MSNSPVDRDKNYMYQMWGTTKLTTDYESSPEKKKVIQEIMHDLAPIHDLKGQTDLHEKIRNDDDYDDWSYGLDATYGKKCP